MPRKKGAFQRQNASPIKEFEISGQNIKIIYNNNYKSQVTEMELPSTFKQNNLFEDSDNIINSGRSIFGGDLHDANVEYNCLKAGSGERPKSLEGVCTSRESDLSQVGRSEENRSTQTRTSSIHSLQGRRRAVNASDLRSCVLVHSMLKTDSRQTSLATDGLHFPPRYLSTIFYYFAISTP